MDDIYPDAGVERNDWSDFSVRGIEDAPEVRGRPKMNE
jgi:hypothetical protein